MLNKKRILGIMGISIQLLLVGCSVGKKSPSDFTQIHSAPTNETSILEPFTKREEEIFIDEEFCENLLRRLVTDDIHIKEGDDEYYFSERFSPEYMEKLKDSNFYIIDINGDGILDIGIKFPTNVLTTYRYDQEEDSLIPSIGLHMYTEILGEGQYMTVSSSASQTTYFYEIMVNGKSAVTISFGKELVGTSLLADGTEEYVFEYTVNSVQVTQEQWELLSEPLWELQKNAPQPYTYEDMVTENY